MSNTPSDAEILALAQQHLKAFAQFTGAGEVWFEGEVEFARAVLAEWGTPPVMAGEPVAWRVHPFDHGIGSQGVYAITSLPQQRDAWLRKGWKVEPLYNTPQPVVREPVAWRVDAQRRWRLLGYLLR